MTPAFCLDWPGLIFAKSLPLYVGQDVQICCRIEEQICQLVIAAKSCMSQRRQDELDLLGKQNVEALEAPLTTIWSLQSVAPSIVELFAYLGRAKGV